MKARIDKLAAQYRVLSGQTAREQNARYDSDTLRALADVRKLPRAKRRELDRKYRERAKRLDNHRGF